MIEIRETEKYIKWFNGLRDLAGRSRIKDRVDRLAGGHAGDSKPVGGGVFELRINLGPGYRVYYMHRGHTLIILLAGGDKSSQSKDITAAIKMATQMSKEDK